jgi:putative transcriptional regulator
MNAEGDRETAAGNLAGRLLVSTPFLLDPNFYRTVVYLAEHSSDGALGLVLNRPTSEYVADHVEGWSGYLAMPDVVFVGGPVSNEIAVAVAQNPAVPPESWQPELSDVGLLDITAGPESIGGVDRLRIFSGYAGWVTGQLEMELASGSWFVVDAIAADVFTSDPEGLWSAVLRRQPGRLAFYASFPEVLADN